MPHRPLPEAIRGCWFFIPDASPHSQSGQKNSSIIHFNIDGSYERFQIKENARKTIEQGTYTFDGMFLILRGRNTETYRVHPEDFSRWNIEGKKDGQALVRGYASHFNATELSVVQKEIHTTHVTVIDAYTHPILKNESNGGSNGIYQLTYTSSTQSNENIANFFVEVHSGNRLWIGLSPCINNIKPATWQRIIQDCYLDIYLNKPADIDIVTIALLNSDDIQTFHYKTAS